MLRAKQNSQDKTRREFVREMSVLASLRHPCICSFFGTCELPRAREASSPSPSGDGGVARHPALVRDAASLAQATPSLCS